MTSRQADMHDIDGCKNRVWNTTAWNW